MGRYSAGTRAIVVSVLAVVAAVGYLAGRHGAASPPTGSASASRQASRLVSAADVLLEVPARWQSVRVAPGIPGLVLESQLAIAPGNAADGGLLAGQLPKAQASPLPSAFLRSLHVLPHTEVLNFLGGQAYEYSGFAVPGYGRALTLYLVPTTGEGTGPTLLACYAAKGFESLLTDCQQIVAKLTLVGQSQYDLNPDAEYAGHLGGLVRSLDTERLALRRRMRASAQPAVVATLSKTLAGGLATTAAKLTALEAPIAADAAQGTLITALGHARSAYEALGRAARSERLASYNTSLVRVEHADAEVDAALESFALLGYG